MEPKIPEIKLNNLPEQKEKLSYRILCADDNEVNRELLIRQLSSKYDFVKVVESGQALLAELKLDSGYNCILSDNTMLPEMQGVDALRQIRADGNEIPFVLYTTDTDTLQIDVEKLGGVFLSKPATRDQICNTIN